MVAQLYWETYLNLKKKAYKTVFTSVLRPSSDVSIPRTEFNPTSRASSGIWDE